MNKNTLYIIFIIVFYAIHFLLVKTLPHFWDHILFSSKLPIHFLDNGLFNFNIDPKIDAGHPPLWSWILALIYSLFGKSLMIGHLLMLPLLILNAFLFLRIMIWYEVKHLFPVLLLLIFEPTYLSHSTMVSQEIAIICGFLSIVFGILYEKKYLIIIASILIALISIRGALLVFALYFFHVFHHKELKWDHLIKYYLPAGILFIVWYFYHYNISGYILKSPDSGWAANSERASLLSSIKQIGILCWRVIDFGRITLVLVSLTLLSIFIKKEKFSNSKFRSILALLISSSVILTIGSVFLSNPILHRYYIAIYIILILLFAFISNKLMLKRYQMQISFLILLSFILGHFIVYNDHISQGWDGSLAHLPYFKLKQNAISYIEKSNLEPKEIVSAFPMINGYYYSDFLGQLNNFVPYDENTFKNYKYFLQSNIMNDISDKDLEYLKKHSKLIYRSSKNYIEMNIYEIK